MAYLIYKSKYLIFNRVKTMIIGAELTIFRPKSDDFPKGASSCN